MKIRSNTKKFRLLLEYDNLGKLSSTLEEDYNDVIKEMKQIENDSAKLIDKLAMSGITYTLNSSGSEGAHLTVFSNVKMLGKDMRYFLRKLQVDILGEERHEVFP